jgi:hypothetical protein
MTDGPEVAVPPTDPALEPEDMPISGDEGKPPDEGRADDEVVQDDMREEVE